MRRIAQGAAFSMVELTGIFFGSLFIGFSGAVMPGPLLAMTIKESLGRSRMAAIWLSIGHSMCELLIVGLFVAGVSRLLPVQALIGPVGLIGGLLLLWMAYGAFGQARLSLEPLDPSEAESGPSPVRGLILGGAAVTVSNPYWLLWWLTVGMGLLISAQLAGVAGIILFYIGHILSDFLWFGFVGFAVGKRRDFLSGNLYRWIITTCAVLLLCFGLMFALYGGRVVYSTLVSMSTG
jgi:threonine/homoserine/homoserine lactone efflux protein